MGGFLEIYQILVLELGYKPSKIHVETAFGKIYLFLLGKEYPALTEEDAKALNHTNGVKYHLPKGIFELDRYFMSGNVEAIALQGLDSINLFWLEVS